MNEYSHYFTDKALNLVQQLEKLCFHEADFASDKRDKAFATPQMKYQPETENKKMKVEIFCPVCGKLYSDASRIMLKEICMYHASLSEMSMLEEVSK